MDLPDVRSRQNLILHEGKIGLRIIVTGGSGFIGTNLIEHFAANGDQVLNTDFCIW